MRIHAFTLHIACECIRHASYAHSQRVVRLSHLLFTHVHAFTNDVSTCNANLAFASHVLIFDLHAMRMCTLRVICACLVYSTVNFLVRAHCKQSYQCHHLNERKWKQSIFVFI